MPRAHSIGGVSISFAFHKNWSVKQVLKAARPTWRSNTVIASYYLKDIAFSWESYFSLGPFVTAGQVIDKSSLT